jgi:hypothetical protein
MASSHPFVERLFRLIDDEIEYQRGELEHAQRKSATWMARGEVRALRALRQEIVKLDRSIMGGDDGEDDPQPEPHSP